MFANAWALMERDGHAGAHEERGGEGDNPMEPSHSAEHGEMPASPASRAEGLMSSLKASHAARARHHDNR